MTERMWRNSSLKSDSQSAGSNPHLEQCRVKVTECTCGLCRIYSEKKKTSKVAQHENTAVSVACLYKSLCHIANTTNHNFSTSWPHFQGPQILMTPTIRADKLSCETEHAMLSFLFTRAWRELWIDYTDLIIEIYLFYFSKLFIFVLNK